MDPENQAVAEPIEAVHEVQRAVSDQVLHEGSDGA